MTAPRRPAPDADVVLLTADGGRYDGRVAAAEADDVTVTTYTSADATALLSSGERSLTLQWVTPTGLYESPAKPTPPRDGGPGDARVMLRLHGEVSQSQRRTFVRVPVDLTAQLSIAGRPYTVQVVDLSESGARLFLSGGTPTLSGQATMRIMLPDGELQLGIQTARDAQQDSVMVVTFVDVDERSATAIRKALFARQRELRAAGRL